MQENLEASDYMWLVYLNHMLKICLVPSTKI